MKDEQLRKADCRLSTLKKGDAVLFDARILHCGNANHIEKGSDRALFNLSFRNPVVTGNLGYPGSIRPGYCNKMTLRDMKEVLAAAEAAAACGEEGASSDNAFAKYGDGISY